jgi:hypothetical protein
MEKSSLPRQKQDHSEPGKVVNLPTLKGLAEATSVCACTLNLCGGFDSKELSAMIKWMYSTVISHAATKGASIIPPNS